ncbi:MAG: polymer-forming cytoskeletal protein [Pseudomonadota bacterium]
MFRRKDSDPAETGSVTSMPNANRPAPDNKPQPDMPRRTVEMASASASAPANIERSRSGSTPPAAVSNPEAKRLIVGNGISLSGEITACDRLVVEGRVQVTLNETKAIEITESGQFTDGKAEVEEAEISGVYEGELTVRNRLLIRGTGRVQGTVRYGELQIERGGRLSGQVSMLDGTPGPTTIGTSKSGSGNNKSDNS